MKLTTHFYSFSTILFHFQPILAIIPWFLTRFTTYSYPFSTIVISCHTSLQVSTCFKLLSSLSHHLQPHFIFLNCYLVIFQSIDSITTYIQLITRVFNLFSTVLHILEHPHPSEMTYFGDDTSYYYHSEPVYYIDTPPYDDEDHLEPTYDDDWSAPISLTLYEIDHEHEFEANAVTVEEGIYYEEDIHPAYRDPQPITIGNQCKFNPLLQPLPPSMTPPMIASSPHNSLPISILHTASSWMKNWNIKDAENKALGRIVPGSQPPPQPYQGSNEFKDVAQSVERTRAAQRWRIEQDAEGIGECMILVPTHPQSTQSTSLPHHDFNNQSITTSPPDICIPHPFPLSPNIWHKPTHRISAFLVAAIKPSEHCYYFGSPIRCHRSSKLRNTRILPPDTHIPRPIPPKPNIPIQQLTFNNPIAPSVYDHVANTLQSDSLSHPLHKIAIALPNNIFQENRLYSS